ncbi:hypothetical protein BV25DRAFT_1909692 [Artomyces pyxidatus]|uniref:Uncharacterized protein n=1 Tax=Artomyces pyxidatus TaxID=48021 RepID=A0ACB8SLC5_9AGAM|nr:hypothetical protein BV25DRAFT_1909692 [Artomyces pyxidatus]
MSTPDTLEVKPDSKPRGRGRGNRGGLGKYLRARGRGRGGRPAEFHQRLVLEGERPEELDEEEARELETKYSRRQLGTNADRYVEPEPELGSDGEEIVEPEVDLSKFLERQRLDDAPGPSIAPPPVDEDDVDHSLARISSKGKAEAPNRKGKVQQIEWDDQLEEMTREKAVAEAHWDLKERFRARTAQQRGRPAPRGAVGGRSARRQEKGHVEAPPLPTEIVAAPKDPKAQMEDFLDDLLT